MYLRSNKLEIQPSGISTAIKSGLYKLIEMNTCVCLKSHLQGRRFVESGAR